jgi:hypothetical protein
MQTVAHTKVVQCSLSAVITRADGRVEDQGVISYWHSNPLKRIAWRIKRFFGIA